ncbi:MAG: class I SAM-dependent methyltransferase [Gammaproteobacteria bacterium]|nr:class I SAM-dependent methyltransferase [Gammaproteobacteria bacterium]
MEDWGCGLGGFKHCIDERQRYAGVDGSQSPYADLIVDLERYASSADAIHMRHVLEHNPGWPRILASALESFRKRMVLTLFTPFQNPTQVIARYPNFNGTGVEMVDIGFAREDIVRPFSDLRWFSIENIRTDTQYGVEHMFFLEK